MTTTVTYSKQRSDLFGTCNSHTFATFNIPNSSMEYKGKLKQFVVYVSDKDNQTHLQKLNSSYTLEEAKKIIEYEMGDTTDSIFGADYTDGFVFKVKDTIDNIMYIYDTKTKTLNPHLG